MSGLKARVMEAAEFSWDALIKVSNHEWPFKRYGAMVPDMASENGDWYAWADSGPGKGNITWETESVPMAVLGPDEVVVPRPLLLALGDCVEALEKIREGALGDVNWGDADSFKTAHDGLTALRKLLSKPPEEG